MKSKAAVKLKSSSGETIVEVLASVLISSLAIFLLFSTIMASVRIDRTAQESDEKYYGELSAAEAGEAVEPPEVCMVTIEGYNGNKYSVQAISYGDKDGLHSYRLGESNEENP